LCQPLNLPLADIQSSAGADPLGGLVKRP
jgi:hypothetical protein